MQDLNIVSPICQPLVESPLNRPARLKRWSLDLTGILGEHGRGVFPDGWDFRGKVTRSQFDRYLSSMRACGSSVELRASLDCGTGEVGPMRVRAANYCHQHTVCPYCAGRVQDLRMRRFADPIKAAASEYPYAYLVTMTLPPSQSWRAGLDALRSALVGFRKMGQKRKSKNGTVKRGHGEWGKVDAALAKVELKRGAGSGLPHVHAHALIFTVSRLDYKVFAGKGKKRSIKSPEESFNVETGAVKLFGTSKLSREWNAATGGDAWSIHCAPLTLRKSDRRAGRGIGESILMQSLEVLKYATKFDSRPEIGREQLFVEDFAAIRDATYSRRLFSTYGAFRGLPETEFVDDGCALMSSPLFFEATWNREARRYNEVRARRSPLFRDVSASEYALARLTALNRFLGRARRGRNAIIGARDRYLDDGRLMTPLIDDADSDETEIPVPQGIIDDTYNMDLWEGWINDWDLATREKYKALSAELNKFEESQVDFGESKRDPSKRSEYYWSQVINAFLVVSEKVEPFSKATYSPWYGLPPVPVA